LAKTETVVKFLLVLLVVGVGLWMLLSRLRGPGAGGADGEEADAARAKKPATPQPMEMVVCAHCGVHLPATDALALGTRLYCSDAHRRLGPAQNPPP
jgi:uncharacterized protein